MPDTDRQATARATAAGLRTYAANAEVTPVLIGFDGFVDSIISVVDKRYDVDTYDAIPTIARFGEKISAAAGKSSNYELVTQQQKLGGNGPIMANAMARAGFKIDYIGAVGDPRRGAPHPIFIDFARIATLHPIAFPALTDALEFSDGKLMLGKQEPLRDVNQSQIDKTIGREAYTALITQAKLIGVVNWSMCPQLGTVFKALADEILPAIASHANNSPCRKAGVDADGRSNPRLAAGARAVGAVDLPQVFVDLTDPEKRTRADLKSALEEIANLATMTGVTLGLNLKEASQVAHVLGIEIGDGSGGEPELAIEATAANIRRALGLRCCCVHPRRAAAGAMIDDAGNEHRATFFGPFIDNPKLSTGAGDNFNAGFCLGLLAGLPLDQMLCAGTATSGYYVRNAQSPTLKDLAEFCDELPEPE